MPNIRLKRYTGATWEDVEVQTDWSQILNKPATFTPSSHTHDVDDLNTTGTASSSTFLRGDGTWAVPDGVDNYVNITGDTMTGILEVSNKVTVGNAFTSSASNRTNTLNILSGSTSNGAVNGIKFHENVDGFGMSFGYDGTGSGTGNKLAWYTSENAQIMDLLNTVSNTSLRVNGNTVFNDGYHPNADTLTTARNIALTGDVTGSANFDGSANISITATVADDSHNHIIGNIDGLQTALDAKANLSGGTFTGEIYAPKFIISADSDGANEIPNWAFSEYNNKPCVSSEYISDTYYPIYHEGNMPPGSWTEIKAGEDAITSGTATTTVSITTGTLSADDIVAIEFHTVDVEGTYSTSIQHVKLGSASSNLYSAVMFPSYNSGTSMRISFARVWLASSTQISFSYSYYGEIDSTPTVAVDSVYVGKIWKINGVTGV